MVCSYATFLLSPLTLVMYMCYYVKTFNCLYVYVMGWCTLVFVATHIAVGWCTLVFVATHIAVGWCTLVFVATHIAVGWCTLVFVAAHITFTFMSNGEWLGCNWVWLGVYLCITLLCGYLLLLFDDWSVFVWWLYGDWVVIGWLLGGYYTGYWLSSLTAQFTIYHRIFTHRARWQ